MKEDVMNCKQAQDVMLASARPAPAPNPAYEEHLRSCAACAQAALALRDSMALLDEWQAPEPSPYFDVRLRARLREEAAQPALTWWQWLRKPAAGMALAALLVAAVGLFTVPDGDPDPLSAVLPAQSAPLRPYVHSGEASAVADLQALERHHDLFAHFELLDEMILFEDEGWREF